MTALTLIQTLPAREVEAGDYVKVTGAAVRRVRACVRVFDGYGRLCVQLTLDLATQRRAAVYYQVYVLAGQLIEVHRPIH